MRVTSKLLLGSLLLSSVQFVYAGTVCLTNKDGVTEAWQTNEKDASLFSASSCGEPVAKAVNPAQVKVEQNKNSGQLWVTSPADVTMRQLIQKWSGTVGWTLVWNVDKDIPLESSDQTTGDFKFAVRRLLSTTALSDVSIKPCFYTNQVVRVVRETTKCNPNE